MRDKQHLKLSKNQALVYEALSQASKPVGAYDLLDQLKAHGLKAPLQIYRALDRLIGLKVVHRLESLNAWTTCCDADHDSPPIFIICDDCGDVKERIDTGLNRSIENISKKSGFTAERPIVEIHGRCGDCSPKTN
jgi:Fur family zinc uptake transcriptional regulator